MEMICTQCKNIFNDDTFRRQINCPDCGSMQTCSYSTYAANEGYKRDMRAAEARARKEWKI